MISRFALPLALLALMPSLPARADVDNINRDANLVDEGITPPAIHSTTVLDGIPLMDGLQPYSDGPLIDILPDSPAHSAVAVGVVDVDQTYDYYKKALPPMGWKPASGRDYYRQGETLHINVRGDGKTTTVTFTEKGSS
ncbi:MAG: hypothetical protein KGI37_08660 [Alphaproteobacteria bacterium]|nr:hypothetical protein [Alphaproteobacteria bacterium]